MRFSIGLPPNLGLARYAELAVLVERHDFSLLVIDDIPNFQSCWAILFVLARATRRVQLGPSVTHPYQRHPLLTVADVAALDELSGGRAFLGWGRGDANDHRAMHLDMPRPLRAVREAVALTRHLLSGRRGAFAGEVFRLDAGFGLGFTPLRPAVPIHLGTTGRLGFRLAGEVADGVHAAGLMSREAVALAREAIGAGARAAGRAPADVDLAASCWTSVGRDASAARALVKRLLVRRLPLIPALAEAAGVERPALDAMAAHVARGDDDGAAAHVSDRAAEAFSFCGTPGDAVRRLEEVAAAGIGHVIFKPPLGPDPAEAIRLLGERVLPHFRGAGP
jgi:5,10-methylenetetrahydromethanopterin reductase